MVIIYRSRFFLTGCFLLILLFLSNPVYAIDAVITSVTPSSANNGEFVTIHGTNFLTSSNPANGQYVAYLLMPSGGSYILGAINPYTNNTQWEENAITFKVVDSIPRYGSIMLQIGDRIFRWSGTISLNGGAPSPTPTPFIPPPPSTNTPVSEKTNTPTLKPTVANQVVYTPTPTPVRQYQSTARFPSPTISTKRIVTPSLHPSLVPTTTRVILSSATPTRIPITSYLPSPDREPSQNIVVRVMKWFEEVFRSFFPR